MADRRPRFISLCSVATTTSGLFSAPGSASDFAYDHSLFEKSISYPLSGSSSIIPSMDALMEVEISFQVLGYWFLHSENTRSADPSFSQPTDSLNVPKDLCDLAIK